MSEALAAYLPAEVGATGREKICFRQTGRIKFQRDDMIFMQRLWASSQLSWFDCSAGYVLLSIRGWLRHGVGDAHGRKNNVAISHATPTRALRLISPFQSGVS
jgi:hypothetical protein